MAPDITLEEIYRLSRSITLKNAAAGLPHGGAKSGIIADPACGHEKKEILVRSFASMIKELTEYIPGPDMGTNEECMAWVKDEIGRAAGLPAALGGIPLDEIGATGFGVAVAAEVAAPAARPDALTENNVDQLKARLVIHGANIPATETSHPYLICK